MNKYVGIYSTIRFHIPPPRFRDSGILDNCRAASQKRTLFAHVSQQNKWNKIKNTFTVNWGRPPVSVIAWATTFRPSSLDLLAPPDFLQQTASNFDENSPNNGR